MKDVWREDGEIMRILTDMKDGVIAGQICQNCKGVYWNVGKLGLYCEQCGQYQDKDIANPNPHMT